LNRSIVDATDRVFLVEHLDETGTQSRANARCLAIPKELLVVRI
jgi:hypothetical protein